MADLPTFPDLFRKGRDEMLARQGRLTRDVIEREGSDANVLLAGGTAVADECITQLSDVEAGMFLDSATGAKLDRWVFDRYGLLRKPAAPARGRVNFVIPGGAPGNFTIPSGVVLQTADGIQFVTVGNFFVVAGVNAVIGVPVRSVLAGLDQQAGATTITSLVSSIQNAPASMTVTNPLATAGADDEEADPELRNRARRFWANVRRGTLGAIENGALAVPGVRRAKAFEAIDAGGRPARFVQLVIADAFTDALASNVPPLAYQTQAQELSRAVFDGLSDVRCGGIDVRPFVAQLILQPVTLQLRFIAGYDTDQVALEARAAVVVAVNQLQPGANLTPALVATALASVPGLQVTGAELISPAGTVVVNPLQVLRTSLSLVLASAQLNTTFNASGTVSQGA